MIVACKAKSLEEGTADLPEKYGEVLLSLAREEQPAALRIVERARKGGARDEDIAEWWNLHDLERRMVLLSEDAFRLAHFASLLEQGLDAEEAGRRVHQMWPIYGDLVDTPESGDDRPLPHELRGRVDRYRVKHGAASIREWSSQYSTYNAFIRDEIRRGYL